MADFRIRGTVWLHNRPFKPGQEDALESAGMTKAQRKEQVARGAIVEVSATEAPTYSPATSTVATRSDAKLSALTVKELRRVAKTEGATLGKGFNKAQIVAAIEKKRR